MKPYIKTVLLTCYDALLPAMFLFIAIMSLIRTTNPTISIVEFTANFALGFVLLFLAVLKTLIAVRCFYK